MCRGCGGTPKSRGESKAEEALGGGLKAEVRPLVSLPTAKPLSRFYPVARNSALERVRERDWASRTAPKEGGTRQPHGAGVVELRLLSKVLALGPALGKGSSAKSQFRGGQNRAGFFCFVCVCV